MPNGDPTAPDSAGPEVGDRVSRDEARARREYARRATDDRIIGYRARVGPALAAAQDDRRGLLLSSLDVLGARPRLRVLDVGCGPGLDLEFLAASGFANRNLAGVDIVADRVAEARSRVPGADVRLANGAAMPYQDGCFDAVIQAVSLSSVLDPAVRSAVAAEMLRVTRPGGRVVSYDMTFVLDRNPHLVGIDRREVERLFGSQRIVAMKRLTLFLPLAARAPAWARRLASRIPFLNSHLMAVVEREGPETVDAPLTTSDRPL